MRFIETTLKGVTLIEPDVFEDRRGLFFEMYHARRYTEGGIPPRFVQDNFSRSVRGTLRGLHYQLKNPQGKLIVVLSGAIFDVALDIRRGSPMFGKWHGVELSADNKRQIYIPPGFAHGFCVLSETASVVYKCTDFYSADDDRGIIWNDQAIGIAWPVHDPLLSPKDRAHKSLVESEADLPIYTE